MYKPDFYVGLLKNWEKVSIRKSGFGQRYVQAKIQMFTRQIESECNLPPGLKKSMMRIAQAAELREI